jgi:hypothetical protein
LFFLFIKDLGNYSVVGFGVQGIEVSVWLPATKVSAIPAIRLISVQKKSPGTWARARKLPVLIIFR